MEYKVFDNRKDKILISLVILFFVIGDLSTTIIGLEMGLVEQNEIALEVLDYGYIALVFFKITGFSIIMAMTLWARTTRIKNIFYNDVKHLYSTKAIHGIHFWIWENMYLLMGVIIGILATVNNLYYIIL